LIDLQKPSKIFYKDSKFTIIFLISILIIPFFLLIDNIELPGPYVDDSRIIMFSQQFIENDDSLFSFKILGQIFPLGNFYNGLSQLYIINAPVVYLLGPTLMTIRVIGIILFVLTTIFTYLFAKELFNQKIGLVSASFFALAPTIFLVTKYPSFGMMIMALFLVVSFYLLIKWKNTKKISYMISAFIIFGLGFDIKINFIWPVIALIFGFIIFRPKLDITLKNIGIMIICSITGAVLFVVKWMMNFDYYLSRVSYFAESPRNASSNTEIIPNLVARFEQVFELINGNPVSIAFGGSYSNESFAVFFFLSIVGIILMWKIKRDQYSRRSLFLVLIFLVILVLSIFTLTTRNVTSLFFVIPIIATIMAVFLVTSTEKIKKLKNGKAISPIIFFSILVFLIIGNIVVINDYKAEAEKTGGIPAWSTHFQEAGKFLLEQNYSKATMLDIELEASIYVSTEGKVDIRHLNVRGDNKIEKYVSQFKTEFSEALKDPEMVFLKFNDDYTPKQKKKLDIINQVLDKENKKFIIIKSFQDWRGNNHTTIYKAVNLE